MVLKAACHVCTKKQESYKVVHTRVCKATAHNPAHTFVYGRLSFRINPTHQRALDVDRRVQ